MLGRVHDSEPARAIDHAVRLIPDRLQPLVACEFVVGADPVFAGIHRWVSGSNGMLYRDVAHCVYDFHQLHRPVASRGTKVVLPSEPRYAWDTWRGVRTVVHELGHVLHQRLEYPVAEPVTRYARTNRYEAFAEAFAAWVWGEQVDVRTTALLEQLVDA